MKNELFMPKQTFAFAFDLKNTTIFGDRNFVGIFLRLKNPLSLSLPGLHFISCKINLQKIYLAGFRTLLFVI